MTWVGMRVLWDKFWCFFYTAWARQQVIFCSGIVVGFFLFRWVTSWKRELQGWCSATIQANVSALEVKIWIVCLLSKCIIDDVLAVVVGCCFCCCCWCCYRCCGCRLLLVYVVVAGLVAVLVCCCWCCCCCCCGGGDGVLYLYLIYIYVYVYSTAVCCRCLSIMVCLIFTV